MRDKNDNPLKIGDEVYCFIPGHGSPASYGFVIGVMSYAAKDEDVVCIASEKYHTGMPVNTAHLQRTGQHHLDAARLLRAMYQKKFPDAFKAEL